MGTQHNTHCRSCNKPFEIALIRHPAVEVPPGTCYGRLDVPLAPGWNGCVETYAGRLAGMAPVRIWSSPSSRCALVASALAARLHLPVCLDKRLQELDFGAWENTAWAQLPRAALDLWASDPMGFSPPGGETGARLIERVTSFSNTLAADAQQCIVVSHGGPLRLLPALLQRRDPDLLAASPALGSLEILLV